MRVVDAHGAAARSLGQELLGGLVARGAQDDVDAVEGLGASELDGDLLAAEGDLLAHGAGGRQRNEPLHEEIPLLEALEHLGPDDARGAQDSDNLTSHVFLPSGERNSRSEPITYRRR